MLQNSLLFGLSSLGAKSVALLLTRLYTGVFSRAEFGTLDLLIAFVNLAVPLAALGMPSAVVRFGLDAGENSEQVAATGLAVTGWGSLGVCAALPFLLLSNLAAFVPYLALYVLVSCLRNCMSQIVRAQGRSLLYAADGLFNALCLLLFSWLLIPMAGLGLSGYLLAVLAADLASGVNLYVQGRLWTAFRREHWDKPLARRMLAYGLPLVPASLLWWLITAADRFMLVYFCGAAANGMYAAAAKVPALISLLSTIFTEAWQLSAFAQRPKEEQGRFFTRVMQGWVWMVFALCSLLMLLVRPVMGLLVGPDFLDAWRYTPPMLLGAFFLCLSSFLNSVYLVAKKSLLSLGTMGAGAVLNVALNLLWIPAYGPLGAAWAMAAAYGGILLLRLGTCRHQMRIPFFSVAAATLLLVLQCLAALG